MSIVDNLQKESKLILKKYKKVASAGNRTRINCLEGSYADHYTTDADKNNLYKFVDHNKIKGAITEFVKIWQTLVKNTQFWQV